MQLELNILDVFHRIRMNNGGNSFKVSFIVSIHIFDHGLNVMNRNKIRIISQGSLSNEGEFEK